MSTVKSQDQIVNDINMIHQKIIQFNENQQSLHALDSEIEQRPSMTDHYNSSLIAIRDEQQDLQNLNLPNQSEFNYYEEYKKIYVISYHLFIQKNKHMDIKAQMEKKIKSVEDKLRDLQKQELPKKDSQDQNRAKRARRTAEEIQRRFKCQVEFCQRSYGSQGSLQQHIKLKHPQLYKKYEYPVYASLNE